MNVVAQKQRQFQGGGTLRQDSYYISRSADDELFHAIRSGNICSVLAPRQTGKSSLRKWTEGRLQNERIHCVNVDLSSFSDGVISSSLWYRTVADTIARGLGLVDEFDAFWDIDASDDRWAAFICDYLPGKIAAPVVVFLDETDSVLALSFKTDKFFATIRAAYNARVDDQRLERLTFCMLGVLSPRDLIDDPVRTPFNVGEHIRLVDFTREEIQAFAEGLTEIGGSPSRLLDEVYRWTMGHPYMTHKLCEKLVRQGPSSSSEQSRVAALVTELFLERGQTSDSNLSYAAERFTLRARSADMLELYRRVRSGEHVLVQGKGSVEEELWLTGMVAEYRQGSKLCLRVRNPIFHEIFDELWINAFEARRELSEPLSVWRKHDRHPDYLLRGAALEKALQWAHDRDLTREEHKFLRDSLALQSRETTKQRRTALVGAVMVVVLTIFSAMLLYAYKNDKLLRNVEQITAERERAIIERDIAVTEKRSAEAAAALAGAAAADAAKKKTEAENELKKAQDELNKAKDELHNVHEELGSTKRKQNEASLRLGTLDDKYKQLHEEYEAMKLEKTKVEFERNALNDELRCFKEGKACAGSPFKLP